MLCGSLSSFVSLSVVIDTRSTKEFSHGDGWVVVVD